MPLQDITITGSIGSIVTQSYGQRTYISSTDDQSFPLETITGSQAGSWPNFVPGTNYTVDLIVNVTQSWAGSNVTPVGIVPFVHDTNDEFFNGEFSGSNYIVTDGNLTDEDCQQFLEVNTTPTSYSVFPYFEAYLNGTPTLSSGSFGSFIHRYTSPNPGQLLFSVREDTNSGTKYTKIEFVKIARIDQEGNDNTLSLQELTSLRWTDSTAGEIILNIINITEYPNYYLYEVTSKTWINLIYFADDNVLDYTFTASSTITSIPTNQYSYLTSSWTVNTDTAGGFSNGQYTFPLTPNCGITYTASIGLTLTTSASFSLAINGYDPLYPIYVPNAATSVPSPISITGNGTNVYYLSPGTHNITISSSNNFPIQNYKYEIDAYLYNSNVVPNSQLIGTGSINNPDQLPSSWMCTQTGSISLYLNNLWFSTTADDPNFQIPDYSTKPIVIPNYPGGVVFARDNAYQDCQLMQSATGLLSFFNVGETYYINITIPEPFTIYNADENLFTTFGPSLYPLTCSLNKFSPTSPASIIGYIPSGAYGTFTFTRTATIADEAVVIVTNPSCSFTFAEALTQQSGPYYAHYLTIAEITAYVTSSATVNNLSFKITQSQLPQTSTSSVILEPYLTSTFRNSDCDVLMNNASQNDISGTRRRVLYNDGYIIPSNFQQIISGTAEFAEVNDYLYNANANVLPRYLGVRTTSPGFNLPSVNGLTSTELSELDSNNFTTNTTVANVQSLQTYFAYYDYITSSYAELLNKSIVHILYLFDKDGNVFTPSLSSSYYYNLIDNFETDKNVNVNLNSLNNVSVIGLRKVLRPGAIPWGICASQIGSTNNYITTMSFSNNTSTALVPNFASLALGPTPFQQFGLSSGVIYVPINLSSSVYSGAGTSIDLNNDRFQINQTANNVSLNLKLEGSIGISLQQSGPTTNTVSAQIICQESPDGTSWTTIDTKNITIVYGISTNLNLNFTSFVPRDNYYYRLIFSRGYGYYSTELRSAKISLVQTPIPSTAGEITSSYWITGSNSKNILTGSQFLQLYNSYRAFQLNPSNSGYKNFLEFNIKSSDQIRFEGDESQVYNINEVTSDTVALYLKLDRNIIDGTNLDSFLIRRYEPHPNFITLDWDGSGYIEGDGFLLSEYISPDLAQNFDNVIVELKERGIY
jgi:hypothetical protein